MNWFRGKAKDFSQVLVPYCSGDLWLGLGRVERSRSKTQGHKDERFAKGMVKGFLLYEMLCDCCGSASKALNKCRC